MPDIELAPVGIGPMSFAVGLCQASYVVQRSMCGAGGLSRRPPSAMSSAPSIVRDGRVARDMCFTRRRARACRGVQKTSGQLVAVRAHQGPKLTRSACALAEAWRRGHARRRRHGVGVERHELVDRLPGGRVAATSRRPWRLPSAFGPRAALVGVSGGRARAAVRVQPPCRCEHARLGRSWCTCCP